ncbi:SIMPL domain-containing protein [Gordonia sp. NPDC003376]
MPPLEIVVRGTARGKYAPERAIVSLSVGMSGEQRDSVYNRAIEVRSCLAAELDDHVERQVAMRWTGDSVWVRSYRPTGRDGRLQPPAYATDFGVEAEFTDFEALSRFIDSWAVRDGVNVGTVRWKLRPESRLRHEADLRREAVADAVAKAQAYADAVGRGPVVAVALSDPGMLGDGPSARGGYDMALAATDGGPPSVSVDLRADDIDIAVAVDARFVAEGGGGPVG